MDAMKWYKKLYLGDNAKDAKYKTIGKVRASKFQFDTYLITLSNNPNNLMDIYLANFLLQPHFKKSHILDDIYVIGIAKGRDESFQLIEKIISEVYSNTGEFKLREYYNFG